MAYGRKKDKLLGLMVSQRAYILTWLSTYNKPEHYLWLEMICMWHKLSIAKLRRAIMELRREGFAIRISNTGIDREYRISERDLEEIHAAYEKCKADKVKKFFDMDTMSKIRRQRLLMAEESARAADKKAGMKRLLQSL